MRWKHLARHGLLGGSLVALASTPAVAEPCTGGGSDRESWVGFTLGVDISPKLSLIGGIEGRVCVSEKAELLLRAEAGGGGIRLIGGARARPFADGNDYNADAHELLGVEAGAAIDTTGSIGAHLAASYGYGTAYAALQALFPLTSRANVPSVTRSSIVLGLSPWSAFESQVVEGRPISVDGELLTPDVIAQFAAARSAEDRAVRDHFTRSAQFEYSSVWTFLRLAAELAAVGAPAALIARALDAADDEVRHAELCGHAAGGLSLAPLAMTAAQPRFVRRSHTALETLAHEAWIEGCINEGAAALEARFAAEVTEDAPTRSTLATIAHDEAGHAALSWAVLAWIRDVAPTAIATHAPRVQRAHDTAEDRSLARRGVAAPSVTAEAHAQASSAAARQLRELVS